MKSSVVVVFYEAAVQRDRLPAVTDMWLVSLADENNSIVLLNYTTLIQLRKNLPTCH